MSVYFFKMYVRPAYDDWAKNPGSLRLSKILASELNNIVEHFWNEACHLNPEKIFHTGSVKAYRDYLSSMNPSIALIRDIADSHKHLIVGRKSSSVEGDRSIGVERIGYGQAYGLRYGGGNVVQIRLSNGEVRYFDLIAKDTFVYWCKILEG